MTCLYFYRYTAEALLNHEFFVEGAKIKILSQQGMKSEDSHNTLHLRMELPTMEASKENYQEPIDFSYNIEKDQPEVVVAENVSPL